MQSKLNWTFKLLVLAISLVLLVFFVAGNFVLVEVRLFLVSAETRLAWALLLATGFGMIAGLAMARLRR